MCVPLPSCPVDGAVPLLVQLTQVRSMTSKNLPRDFHEFFVTVLDTERIVRIASNFTFQKCRKKTRTLRKLHKPAVTDFTLTNYELLFINYKGYGYFHQQCYSSKRTKGADGLQLGVCTIIYKTYKLLFLLRAV